MSTTFLVFNIDKSMEFNDMQFWNKCDMVSILLLFFKKFKSIESNEIQLSNK